MRADLLRGHLDALVLAVLEDQPLHGYGIIQRLRQHSGGSLDVPTGTIYPALRRLESAGRLDGDWDIVEGRRRRVYRLTAAGRRTLANQRADWDHFATVVGAVLNPSPKPS